MAIFDKLKSIFDKKTKIAAADFKRLNQHDKDLGNKTTQYVSNGSNETVLSTLATKNVETELEACVNYSQHKTTHKRRHLFAQCSPYHIDFFVRYTQVLAAGLKTPPDATSGSKHAPDAVRYYFTEMFSGVSGVGYRYSQKKDLKTSVTPDIALQVTEKLGGQAVDFFDCVYYESNEWIAINGQNYRSVTDLQAITLKYPTAFIEAGQRIHAIGREKVILDLSKWQLIDKAPFLEFVLGLAGDSSKIVRDAAVSALKSIPSEKIEDLAIANLTTGKVNIRAGMVDLLAASGTKSALQALIDHRKTEKTARIIAAIDLALSVEEKVASGDINQDDGFSYTAIDGSTITLPPIPLPTSGQFPSITQAEKTELKELIAEENARIKEQIAENKRQGYSYRPSLLASNTYKQVLQLFDPPEKKRAAKNNWVHYHLVNKGRGLKWSQRILEKIPEQAAIQICLVNLNGGACSLFRYYSGNVFFDYLENYINSGKGDFRYLEQINVLLGIEVNLGGWSKSIKRKSRKGDLLRFLLQEQSYLDTDLENFSQQALWPYLADNFDTFDQALGFSAQQEDKLSRISAIRFLAVLPKPPMRYFGSLLEAATGVTKTGRQEARQMLADIKEVEERLVALLDDSRQAVRVGTAEWMAERQDPSASKALKKRLKKEKSELARAAILSALNSLGEDLTNYIGPKALIDEAEKNIAKAKFDKLDWLTLEHLPNVRFKKGKRVPADVLRWWVYLAFKLKQPGSNKLFQIYLDQLNQEDAEKLSLWILDSWINFDTAHPPEQEANTYAKAHAKKRYKSWKSWYKDYTEERAFADIKREMMSTYLNSGTASKGLLALTYCAPSAQLADRVRSYLKNDGSRTSQASSLLEVLATKGDPVCLQVLISAATRLKQKSVQKLANDLLEKVAEKRGWTLDELADRTIPTAGLDDDGILELPCGPDNKPYQAQLDDNLKIILRNPEGKPIKALSSGQDDNTKASKKQLSATRKELKQVISMQSTRLYEALCAERCWSLPDWQQNFQQHPIMCRLIERLVWLGEDKNSKQQTFRPTAEGDFTDAEDNPVDIENFVFIRIAHGALLAESKQWDEHLKDYEIKPLFIQFGRELKRAEGELAKQQQITDRKGWVTDTFTIRGIAKKLGYDRGETLDGGFFNEYVKTFHSTNIAAVIEFSGNCLPEENVAAAIISLQFEKINAKMNRNNALALKDVPPVLLSECWNDYYAMSDKASFDKYWEKRMPWM